MRDRGSPLLLTLPPFMLVSLLCTRASVFSDPVVASVIVDRPLPRATVLNIKGKSYRMRAYQDRHDKGKG